MSNIHPIEPTDVRPSVGKQVAALLRKDVQVLRAHRIRTLFEVVVPLALGGAVGYMLSEFPGTDYLPRQAFIDTSSVSRVGTSMDTVALITRQRGVVERHANSVFDVGGPVIKQEFLTDEQQFTDLLISQRNSSWGISPCPRNIVGITISPSAGSTNAIVSQATLSVPPNLPSCFSGQSFHGASQIAMLWTYGQLYSSSLASSRSGSLTAYSSIDRQSKFTLSIILALVALLGLIPLAGSAAATLVDEKRSKLRGHLLIMGVRPAAYLLAFAVVSTCRCFLFSVSVLLAHLVAASAFQSVMPPISLFVTEFFVLFLVSASMTGFARILPVIFDRPQFAQGVAALFIAGGAMGGIYGSVLPSGVQFVLCTLLSPYAGVTLLAPTYIGGKSTLDIPPAFAFAALPAHVLLYSVVGEYLYALYPGEFGIPLPVLFPLHWVAERCGFQWGGIPTTRRLPLLEEILDPRAFPMQPEMSVLSPEDRFVDGELSTDPSPPAENRVELRQLVKYYGTQRDSPAVAGLTLEVRRGEILSLLGHNGAGKTTAIAVLCGLTPATSYAAATVDGLDVTACIEDIRARLGYCPQFDVIYDDLTGRQHLELYARVKGAADPAAAATAMLRRLDLEDDSKATRDFSGGMKRRLSVGMALVGGAQFVVLDEPSSGLDPASRRGLWQLIREERDAGRTVLLTTHFMEEAEALGDRVAIMSYGKLYCCGTSAALKLKYGEGYFLTCEKDVDSDPRIGEPLGDSFDPDRIMSIIRAFVPKASLYSRAAAAITIQLPIASFPQFSAMFAELEPKLPALGCASLSLRANSLEDVFLRIADAEAEANTDAPRAKVGLAAANGASPTDVNGGACSREAAIGLLADGSAAVDHFAAALHDCGPLRFLAQTRAIWWRHSAATFRTPAAVFLTVVIPLMIVWMGAAAVVASTSSADTFEESPFPNRMDPLVVPVCEVEGISNVSHFDATVRLLLPVFTRAERLFANRNPQKRISFEIRTSLTCLQSNPKSIAFNADLKTPLALMVVRDVPYAPREANLQYAWRRSVQYSSMLYVETAIAFETGLLAAATGRHSGLPDPSVRVAVQPNVWAANFDGSVPSRSQKTMFFLGALGFLSLMGGAILAGSTTVAVADDVNCGTLTVLRAQGLGIGAYWAGLFVSVLPPLLLLVASYVAILYIRDVKPITQSSATLALFAGSYGLCLFHLLLIGALLVFVLPPNLKHATYMSIVNYFLWAEIAIPFSIYGIARAAENEKAYHALVTPPSAFVAFHFYLFWPESQSLTADFGSQSRMAVTAGTWTVGLLLILIGNCYVWWAIRPRSGGPHLAEVAPEIVPDEDVLGEERRVANALYSGTPSDVISARGLRKVFKSRFPATCPLLGKGDVHAVKSATFGVRSGECFGVLGQNGAGKTTTIRMLLHDTTPTAGIATYRAGGGSNNKADAYTVTQDGAFQAAAVGVCVQHDSLIPTATADEHLDLFLRIRLGWSYQPALWREYKANALRSVRLVSPDGDVSCTTNGAAGNKPTQDFSGGMKRKLAACLALHTGASTVFLDEPTTGVDPHARRALWRTIKEVLGAADGESGAGQQSTAVTNRAVILTTHSMTEADAMCDRIAIFAEGTMRCLGSGEHLKRRLGSGYSVSFVKSVSHSVGVQVAAPVKLAPPIVGIGNTSDFDAVDGELRDAMCAAFPKSWLRESLPMEWRFAIPSVTSLAVALRALEEIQRRFRLEAFSISQAASLEDVFLTFAARNSAPTEL